MPTIIRLSEAASIALHAMRLLAEETEGRLTTSGMAATLGMSEAHLSKVLQRLVRRGFVTSMRGPKGGFTLAGDPSRTTLMEVYEAIEGPLSAETCFLGHEVCPRGECMFGGLMETINNLARKQLEGTALSDLVNGSGRRRRDGGDRARGSRRRRKADVRRGAV